MGTAHLAHRIDDFVNRLDRTAWDESYAGVGSEAYPPDLMLKIVLYEILDGRPSPAQWARDLRTSDALRWLGQGIQPSRSALYDFRDRMHGPIRALHAQAIQQAIAEGFTTAEHGVLDGTAIRACASRHRLVHQERLQKRLEGLSAAVDGDLRGQPIEPRPCWMAPSPVGRERQGRRYRRAEAKLADRLARNQERPKDKRLPEKQVRVSLSDPEAPLGRDKEKVFGPLYTVQFVVAADSLLTLSFEAFAQATDAGTLPRMLDRTMAVTGRMLRQIDTDAGYSSVLDLQACQERGVELVAPVQENDFTARKRARARAASLGKDHFQWLPQEQTYVCPAGHRLSYKGRERKRRRDDQTVIQHRFHCPAEHCRSCPLRASCVRNPEKGRTVKRLEGEELLEAHKQRMSTPEAKEARRLRGSVIERYFGDAKEHRKFRRFHGRGLKRIQAEVGLLALAQTALMLGRLREKAVTAAENPP